MWLEHAGVTVAPGRSLGFSHSNMVFDAAIDGLGVALGRSIMVADDLAAGRLVKPFDLSLKAEFAYYLVCPPTQAKVKAFRDWVFDRRHRRAFFDEGLGGVAMVLGLAGVDMVGQFVISPFTARLRFSFI